MRQAINNNPGVAAVITIIICFALLALWMAKQLNRSDRRTIFLMRRLDKKLSVTDAGLRSGVEAMSNAMTGAAAGLSNVSDSMEQRQERMRREMDERLENMRVSTEKRLDALGARLGQDVNTRLGESFKLVSAQLESVYKGLGEMQALAQSVGDLKRVLSGVKTRGVWGEIRLRNLLEENLPAGAYAENVQIKPGTLERVEFAVRLPGQDENSPVWLPIDSKFPMEAHLRLIKAQESGNADEVKRNQKALVSAVLEEAGRISSKYISPPDSTDFAVMFLPTESLYMQVLSDETLMTRMHRDFHVLPVGPSNFAALLNCLQMGFRTLAVEKRSGEIMRMLAGVRTEFEQFGATIDKAKTKLEQAAGDLDSVGTRTRAINKKLGQIDEV